MMFADDDFDIDTEVVLIAENLEDAAARIAARTRPLGDFDIDYQALEVVPLTAMRFLPQHPIGIQLGSAARGLAAAAIGRFWRGYRRRFAFSTVLAGGPLQAARNDDRLPSPFRRWA